MQIDQIDNQQVKQQLETDTLQLEHHRDESDTNDKEISSLKNRIDP